MNEEETVRNVQMSLYVARFFPDRRQTQLICSLTKVACPSLFQARSTKIPGAYIILTLIYILLFLASKFINFKLN